MKGSKLSACRSTPRKGLVTTQRGSGKSFFAKIFACSKSRSEHYIFGQLESFVLSFHERSARTAVSLVA